MQEEILRSTLPPLGVKPTIKKEKLSEKALAEIRSRIVNGSLELGQAISETTLATELNISKTPVREALQELKREGLVQIFPKKGTYVFEVSKQLVNEISDFRLILETAALDRAMAYSWGKLIDSCEKIVNQMEKINSGEQLQKYRVLDAKLHRCIVDHSGNSFIIESYAGIEFRIQALRTRLSTASEQNSRTIKEHRELLSAIASRNKENALTLLSAHISETRNNYLSRLS